MSYDPAADIIDVTVTSPEIGTIRDSVTAERMARSDRQQAKFFASDPRLQEWEFVEGGATWKFARRKTWA